MINVLKILIGTLKAFWYWADYHLSQKEWYDSWKSSNEREDHSPYFINCPGGNLSPVLEELLE